MVTAAAVPYSFYHDHDKDAGKLVYNGCQAGHIVVSELSSNANGDVLGSPCRAVGKPYVLKNNYYSFYGSLVAFAVVGGANLFLFAKRKK